MKSRCHSLGPPVPRCIHRPVRAVSGPRPFCVVPGILRKNNNSLDGSDSVGWALSCKAKGHLFDSPSGHMLRLQVLSPAGVRTRGNQWVFLTLMFLSLPTL